MDHGFMPIVVRVVGQEAFEDWLADMRQKAGAGSN
jgi:heme/copper-type cytochrome/quinol oxidase subunit 2